MTDLLLVDGKHALWRAADTHQDLWVEAEDGTKVDTGAVYGFLRILCSIHQKFQPTGTVICWDDWNVGPAKRREVYPAYKERSKLRMPGEQDFILSMIKQQHLLMEVLEVFGIWQSWSPGWEADDVLGTLAKQFSPREVIIFTGDKDLLQCIGPTVCVARPLHGCQSKCSKEHNHIPKGAISVETEASVQEQYGVEPSRFQYWKALAGDAGDNIPGASGIGPVAATRILGAYADTEAAIEAASGEGPWGLSPSIKERVAQSAALIRLSLKLATINCSAPLRFRPRRPDVRRARDLMMGLKFKSIFQDNRFQSLVEMGGG